MKSDRLEHPAPVFRDLPGYGPARPFGGYGRHLPQVTWPGGARIAVSICLNWEEGSEASIISGDGRNEGLAEIPYTVEPQYRDLATESIYEYGARAGIWRIARILDEYETPTTVFGAAMAYERTPEVADWVRERGHEPCSHGWRWEEVWRLTREEESAHILAAIESIERTCGTRPVGWYSRYGASIHTRELLTEEGGFLYDSDAYNDDLPYHVDVKGESRLVIPYTFVYNDGKFVQAPGYAHPGDFYENLKRGFDYLWEEGATHPKMMSIGLHSRWTGQAGRASALRDFLDYARNKGDVWFATREQIGQWWNANADTFPGYRR